jgi:CheY-like chemotaxis protein
MALVNQFSSKKVLIVDDLPGMRTQLQMSLTHSGFEKLHVVASIKEALQKIQEDKYDIILSDYFLGEGTSGQQFLEYLRTKDLISRNTIFVIITAERTYEKVVTAAECAPDDYLLKPFTAEQLNQRLAKLIDRQAKFAKVDKATDAKDWGRVIKECDAIIADKDKFFIEACKIQGTALIKNGQIDPAIAHYEKVISIRPLPWAKLGLARAISIKGDKVGAAEIARSVLAENNTFMGAYEFLGSVLTESGDKEGALELLQTARQVSPGTLGRIRNIAELAVDTGKPEIAEQVLSEALAKHKHSPVREAQDYATLSKALTEQGKSSQALDVLKEAKSAFKDDVSNVVLATSESIAHQKAGNTELAEAALARALAANHGTLPATVAAAVADACLVLGKEDKAHEILKQVVQNNPDDANIHGKVQAILTASGKDMAEATAMIQASVKEVIQINNDGVRKAQAGELVEAIDLLCDAADRLPNNIQIISNASLALALDLARNGYNAVKHSECLRYRKMVADKASDYPKLAQIDSMLLKVQKPNG